MEGKQHAANFNEEREIRGKERTNFLRRERGGENHFS